MRLHGYTDRPVDLTALGVLRGVWRTLHARRCLLKKLGKTTKKTFDLNEIKGYSLGSVKTDPRHRQT